MCCLLVFLPGGVPGSAAHSRVWLLRGPAPPACRHLGPDWVCPVCAASGYEQAVEQRLADCAVISPLWVHCQVAALERALHLCDRWAAAGCLPAGISDLEEHCSDLQVLLDR